MLAYCFIFLYYISTTVLGTATNLVATVSTTTNRPKM